MIIAGRSSQALRVLHGVRSSSEASKDARDQRIRSKPVGAVVLIFRLARREDAGNICRLLVIDPEAAHGVVHAGKNLHGCVARIVANKLLVDFEDALQLAVERLAVTMRQVKIDPRLPVDAELVFVDNFENRARPHVAWDELAVLWIPLFQEVPAVALWNGLGVALVSRRLRNPDASAFAARRF